MSSPTTVVTNEQLLEELGSNLTELVRRIENYVETHEESREVSDEGLVLAARSDRLLDWAKMKAFSARLELEKFGWVKAGDDA